MQNGFFGEVYLDRFSLSSMLPSLIAAALGFSAPTPTRGVCRTIGVDFGLARVGVAVSSGFAPLPLSVLPCGGSDADDFAAVARAVGRLCAGEGAAQVTAHRFFEGLDWEQLEAKKGEAPFPLHTMSSSAHLRALQVTGEVTGSSE